MDFTHRKLPREAEKDLKVCRVHTVAPFALMATPVYVYFPRNAKYVSVKAPLDFFTPEELSKLAQCGSFFFPKFVDSVQPFRDAAVRVRAVLNWQPKLRQDSGGGSVQEVPMPPAPYEISDAVLRILGPLWGAEPALEPFFAAVFAEEFCEPLPQDLLLRSRESDVALFEESVLASSLTVFLALHLGWCEAKYLSALRQRVFENWMSRAPRVSPARNETDELMNLVRHFLLESGEKGIGARWFEGRGDRLSDKLAARLERVGNELARGKTAPTIYGPKGFRSA